VFPFLQLAPAVAMAIRANVFRKRALARQVVVPVHSQDLVWVALAVVVLSLTLWARAPLDHVSQHLVVEEVVAVDAAVTVTQEFAATRMAPVAIRTSPDLAASVSILLVRLVATMCCSRRRASWRMRVSTR